MLAVAWDRSDRRIDTLDDLNAATGRPVVHGESLSSSTVHALLLRWVDLAVNAAPVIAFVSSTPRCDTATGQVCRQFGRLLQEAGQSVTVMTGEQLTEVRLFDRLVVLVPLDAAARNRGSEATVLAVDYVVLVALMGSRRRQIESVVQTLQQHGAEVGWALLLARSSGEATGWRRVTRSVASRARPHARPTSPDEASSLGARSSAKVVTRV